jgi:hypothetical protein
MMNGQIFIKENLNISDSQLSREVETIDSDDNPFYN